MLLENYLKNQKQSAFLNVLSFSWKKKILAGFPQGSVLGPLLFLIDINDLPHCITSVCKMIADDTSLCSKVKDRVYLSLILIMTWKQLINGFINRKCHLILTLTSKQQKCYFLAK